MSDRISIFGGGRLLAPRTNRSINSKLRHSPSATFRPPLHRPLRRRKAREAVRVRAEIGGIVSDSAWQHEQREYLARREDGIDAAYFLVLLLIGAILVALVRQIAFVWFG